MSVNHHWVDQSLLKELPLYFEEKQLSSCRGEGLAPTRGLVWVNSEILAPGQIVPMHGEIPLLFWQEAEQRQPGRAPGLDSLHTHTQRISFSFLSGDESPAAGTTGGSAGHHSLEHQPCWRWSEKHKVRCWCHGSTSPHLLLLWQSAQYTVNVVYFSLVHYYHYFHCILGLI